jgi:ATP-dependent DNA helicase RecQ
MFVGNKDIATRKRMIKKGTGGAATKRTDNNKFDTMIAFCETLSCRRKAIMTYFGTTFQGDCGNCDNCMREAVGENVTAAARAVIGHVIETAGTEDTHALTASVVEEFRGMRRSAAKWAALVRQLIVNGLIEVRHSDMGRLHATPAGEAFLVEGSLVMPKTVGLTSAKFVRSGRAKSASAPRTARRPAAPRGEPAPYWEKPAAPRSRGRRSSGDSLLEALRAMRNAIAKEERQIEPFRVIHDNALKQMAELKPTTADEMLAIKGVGPVKLSRYCHRFISVIRQHAA